ncbi:MAG: alpha-L-fucosidase [Anaerolineae bacterium]|nr:alpha-L-fucosidase [Anaerolineae bacterium]
MTAKPISDQGLQWFLDSRFGMFIHWGLYSLIARGEWVMHNESIPVAEYEKLVPQFNPVRFNADEWVSIAADAGQKYMVITSRHHDGFSMYNTALSDYKVTNTPFRRDPLEELANAVAKRSDITLGFYSSLLDWHHPAYRFRKESGLAWSDYVEFLHGQVRELCTNFGKIACVWFDGDWPHHAMDEKNAYFAPGGSFEYDALYSMIHDLQPDAYIHNNRHEEPLPGEDIQGFEQDLPGENSAGFNTTTIYDMPIEVCMTMNDNWGVHSQDDNHKSTRKLLHNLIRSASMNGNYLLNVGPTALGEILPEHARRLREMGEWLTVNAESVYGTRAGVVATPDGVSTRRGDTHYVHALQYNADRIYLDGVPEHVTRATLLKTGEALPLKNANALAYVNGPAGLRTPQRLLYVTVPPELRDPIATVIKLD